MHEYTWKDLPCCAIQFESAKCTVAIVRHFRGRNFFELNTYNLELATPE
jgi:hypothetical protein